MLVFFKLGRGDLYPDLRNVELSLGVSPLSWAKGLGEALAKQTYSNTTFSLAQTMSAIVLGSKEGITPEAAAAYQKAEALIRQRQSSSGMLGKWSSSIDPDFTATLLAYDLLQEARERGFDVEAGLLERLRNAAKRIAAQPTEGTGELRTRAHAVYLLTRDGINASRDLADIQERYETFHKETWRADLGAAYVASSYKLLKASSKTLDDLFEQLPWLSDVKNAPSGDALRHDAEILTLALRHFDQKASRIGQEQLTLLGQLLSKNQYSPWSAALLVRALDVYSESAGDQVQLAAVALSGKEDTVGTQLSLSGVPPTVAVPESTQSLRLSRQGEKLPAFYALNESGFDRHAPQEQLSSGLEVIHEYLDLEGKPVSTVTVGQEFLVRTRVRVTELDGWAQVTVVDLLPGGVEPVYRTVSDPDDDEDEDLEGWYAGRAPVGEPSMSDWLPEQVDVREDRVLLHGAIGRDVQTFVYRARAVSVGEFGVSPAYAEDMYDRSLQARSQPGRLVINAP